MALLELENVVRAYGTGEKRVLALDGVSLRVEPGDDIAVVGASGSGKTTLMHLLGLLDSPTEGTVRFDGRELGTFSVEELRRVRNRRIGFVFQSFYLSQVLTALQNVELPLIYGGVPGGERRARAWEALERVGLTDRASHLPKQLSGGQQQRVAIARALVTNPELVLADEPTGNLDPETGAEVLKLLRGVLDEGRTLILITHDPRVAACAARRLLMENGRLTEQDAAKTAES